MKAPGRIAPWSESLRAAVTGPMTPERPVPCGSCTKCCRHAHVHADLTPEELPLFPEAVFDGYVGWRLPKRPSGECVHLVDGRCGIYDRRPASCRGFDCRVYLFGLQPVVENNVDFADDVISMWGPWAVETPQDVDHLLAWDRAAAEAYATEPVAFPDTIVGVVTRHETYAGAAHEVRDDIGYEAARDLALGQDAKWRGHLRRLWRNTHWIRANGMPHQQRPRRGQRRALAALAHSRPIGDSGMGRAIEASAARIAAAL